MRALGRGSVASIIRTALDVAWWVLIAAAVALPLAVLGYLGLLGAIAAGWAPEDILRPSVGSVSLGPFTIEKDSDEDMIIWPVVATASLAAAVAIGGALVIVSRLRALFGNLISEEPFSADNADHLRVIWIAMLVMELSRYLIAGGVFALIALFGQPEKTHLQVSAPVNFMTWGAILVLIVLAEVFREGARLREEDKLTI